MSNPFEGFVTRMDTLVPLLEAGTLDEPQRLELVDLTRRAMFALVNHINAQVNYLQILVLPGEEEATPNDTDESSLGES